jgi:hypothetical protein
VCHAHAAGLEPVMSDSGPVPVRRRWFASSGFGMLALGAALALGFAYASQSVSRALVAMRTASTIKVKGTASVDIDSDAAVWIGSVSARGATLPEAYNRLTANTNRLQKFIMEAGFEASEITPDSVETRVNNARDTRGNELNRIESYTLTRSIAVRSAKVANVKSLSEHVTELIKEGVEVRSGSPAFLLANPDAVKRDLLAEATRNAFERANTLAKGSGSSVGALQSASQGVIKITARGQIDNGEYGHDYDTSTIAKTMRAVVSLEYAIDK